MICLTVSLFACTLTLPSCRLLGTALGLGMAKLQFGCLPHGTKIDTPGGPVRIENLRTGDTIIGFGGSRVQVAQIHQYQEDPATSRYLTVHFSNNSSVCASLKHRIDGIPAKDLKVGDTCGSQVITRIENRKGVSRSFDLLTGDSGYRIGGIPVNSMIEEMMRR
ncbi:MAG: Hint domain-containing protein [Luteolibacter sp.]